MYTNYYGTYCCVWEKRLWELYAKDLCGKTFLEILWQIIHRGKLIFSQPDPRRRLLRIVHILRCKVFMRNDDMVWHWQWSLCRNPIPRLLQKSSQPRLFESESGDLYYYSFEYRCWLRVFDKFRNGDFQINSWVQRVHNIHLMQWPTIWCPRSVPNENNSNRIIGASTYEFDRFGNFVSFPAVVWNSKF